MGVGTISALQKSGWRLREVIYPRTSQAPKSQMVTELDAQPTSRLSQILTLEAINHLSLQLISLKHVSLQGQHNTMVENANSGQAAEVKC